MITRRKLFSGSAALLGMLPLVSCRRQPLSLGVDDPALERPVSPEQVRAEFLHAWNGYKRHAWGHDELLPLSRSHRDLYGRPLLLTPVDALDTMIIMGLADEAAEAKELILNRLCLDQDVNVEHFEISMRLIGGLVAAYELDGDSRLLGLAEEVAKRTIKAFNSPTGLPYRFINLKTGAPSQKISSPAWTGGYLLEYGALSRHTGNPTYLETARRAARALFERRFRTGLYGLRIDVQTGKWIAHDSSVIDADGFYEYLLKAAILFDDPELRQMWEVSYQAIDRYLKDESTGGLWYGHAHPLTGTRTAPVFGALDCYFSALLALNGDLDKAGRLLESAYSMWLVEGIEPDGFDYRRGKVISPAYPLRPEIVESTYYLHHYTADEKYRRMGNVLWNSIVRWCRTETGYTALADVRSKKQADGQHSWFFAETLKYAYLLFSPPAAFDFDSIVFTTEAHPLAKKPRAQNP